MAVKIRLKRMGKIRTPFYRVVVADSRTKRDGRVIEEIGTYNPKADPSVIHIEPERAAYWLGVGAQPSEAVAALLKLTGDWQKFKGEDAPGPLLVAEPRRDKADLFNDALKDAHGDASPDATTSPDRPAKKAAAKKSAKKAAPAKADEPAAEAPAAEAPAAEAPAVDAPAAEAPAVDAPAAEAPAVDAPAPESSDAPASDAAESTES